MKVKLYRKWLKHILKTCPHHQLLKQPNGLYILARKLWVYSRNFPYTDNWASRLKDDFLKNLGLKH